MVFVACMPLAACAVLFEEVADDKKPGLDQLQTARDSSSQNVDAGVIAVLDTGAFPEPPDAGSQESPDADVDDAGLQPWGEEPGYVFVTASGVVGDFSNAPITAPKGVGRGDQLCANDLLLKGKLAGRTFLAYLSDDNVHAHDRNFKNASGWRSVDGQMLSTSPSFWSGTESVLSGLTVLASSTKGVEFWTGSTAYGARQGTCNNWDGVGETSPFGRDGTFYSVSAGNIESNHQNCGHSKRVICIEVAR